MTVLKHMSARISAFEPNSLEEARNRESRILAALAEAYLSDRQEIMVAGVTFESIEAFVARLSDHSCPASVPLREKFSTAVISASECRYSLRTTKSRDDVLHFSPLPCRRERNRKDRPRSFTFTGKFCPLFDFTSGI